MGKKYFHKNRDLCNWIEEMRDNLTGFYENYSAQYVKRKIFVDM